MHIERFGQPKVSFSSPPTNCQITLWLTWGYNEKHLPEVLHRGAEPKRPCGCKADSLTIQLIQDYFIYAKAILSLWLVYGQTWESANSSHSWHLGQIPAHCKQNRDGYLHVLCLLSQNGCSSASPLPSTRLTSFLFSPLRSWGSLNCSKSRECKNFIAYYTQS